MKEIEYRLRGTSLGNMRIVVTGGAGVIGSSLVRRIQGKITVIDNLSSSSIDPIKDLIEERRIRFVKGDVRNLPKLIELTRNVDLVVHLAANGDVRYYPERGTDVDFQINTFGTYNVLEAMRRNDVPIIIYSSSSSVYGYAQKIPTPEAYGPLVPESLYAGSKLGGEGMVSSFAKMFGLSGRIFRFANIVGPSFRSIGANVIPDLILKLRRNPKKLEILGNGLQEKSYLYVTDCIDGMFHLSDRSKEIVDIFNLGNVDSISVNEIAKIIIEEMNLTNVDLNYTGGERGWIGDVPKTILDISKAVNLGWSPGLNSKESVRKSAREIINQLPKV